MHTSEGMHQKCIKSATWRLQEAPKTPPGRPKTDFASVQGANLESSWASFSAQDGLQPPRTSPKGLLGNVLGRLGGVLGPLGGQEPTRASLGAVLAWFSFIFGRFFAWFLVDFWSMFDAYVWCISEFFPLKSYRFCSFFSSNLAPQTYNPTK